MYITREKLAAAVPSDLIRQALTDDGIREDPGAWAGLAAAVHDAIDGPLSRRYRVPFAAPLPPLVTQAALILAAEMIYLRRAMAGERNPWTAKADAIRARLDEVAAGERPLGPQWDREQPSVSTITETAKTYPVSGRLMI